MILFAAALLFPCPTLEFGLSSWVATPQLEIEDAYKWLFHACQGAEHAVPDADGPRQWLTDEWKTLSPPTDRERLWVPLRPDGALGRINLRVYRARGGTEEPLLTAFVASARGYRADRAEFRGVWHQLGDWLHQHPFGRLTHATWNRLDNEVAPRGYPAIDHSDAYERIYHPAYRVLTRREYEGLRISASRR
jgi:hypothetical protein